MIFIEKISVASLSSLCVCVVYYGAISTPRLAGSLLLAFLPSFVQTDGWKDGPPNGDYDHHDCKKLLACFFLLCRRRRRCP